MLELFHSNTIEFWWHSRFNVIYWLVTPPLYLYFILGNKKYSGGAGADLVIRFLGWHAQAAFWQKLLHKDGCVSLCVAFFLKVAERHIFRMYQKQGVVWWYSCVHMLIIFLISTRTSTTVSFIVFCRISSSLKFRKPLRYSRTIRI